MAFLTITEDEAIYILAAIGRVTDAGSFDDYCGDTGFGAALCEKIGSNLLPHELHRVEEMYQTVQFSDRGDTSVNMVEVYHKP